MKAPVYTLMGKITDPKVALDHLLSSYFKTLKSSSNIIPTEVKSLTHDISSSKSANDIKTKITRSLGYILDAYFDSFETNVIVTEQEGYYEIELGLSIKDNGYTIDVGKALQASSSKILIVKELIDKGVR